ncbi:MAG TPA: 4Fe-4S dicluster domain-containing protein [Victivallales bacterium]|nr:4Fe-4S dicluster domain-containing protein [Victivallales bacterium]
MRTDEKKRYVMIIDLQKCLGCKTCTAACCKENGIFDQSRAWHRVLETVSGHFPDYKKKFIPAPCMHCNNPPCVSYCPTTASYKDRKRSIVRIDYSRCITCEKCIDACPYNARVLNDSYNRRDERVISEYYPYIGKCTFCIHKIIENENSKRQTNDNSGSNISPACVKECCGYARYFGDINDSESEVSNILRENNNRMMVFKEEEGTEPNVFYLNGL